MGRAGEVVNDRAEALFFLRGDQNARLATSMEQSGDARRPSPLCPARKEISP